MTYTSGRWEEEQREIRSSCVARGESNSRTDRSAHCVLLLGATSNAFCTQAGTRVGRGTKVSQKENNAVVLQRVVATALSRKKTTGGRSCAGGPARPR